MDMCKGQIDFNIKTNDGFRAEELNGYVKIPVEDISDDYFEIYFEDGIEDCDYHENIDERILKVLYDENNYNSDFLITVCDYAYASNEHEINFAMGECYVSLKGNDFEWNVDVSEDDKIFVSLNIMTMDSHMSIKHSGLPKLLSKEEKLLEIEEISEEVARTIYTRHKVNQFGSHMYNAYTQDFITNDDINRFHYKTIFNELAKWYELEHEHTNLNDLKHDILDTLNIDIDSFEEQKIEDWILSCFKDNEINDWCISEDINNFEIDFEKSVKIISKIIEYEYYFSEGISYEDC